MNNEMKQEESICFIWVTETAHVIVHHDVIMNAFYQLTIACLISAAVSHDSNCPYLGHCHCMIHLLVVSFSGTVQLRVRCKALVTLANSNSG